MDHAGALRYLDEHVNAEASGRVAAPTLDRIERLVDLLGQPHLAYPVIHITGTNGKGSTGRLIGTLLEGHGLTVGTYSSPHLSRVNERITRNGEPISDDDLAGMIAAVASVEPLAGVRPSYFEILTAAAFRWFSDEPVDVAVVEVGLLGRWDATNVVHPTVAVITNVALDHAEYVQGGVAGIAAEKAGIIKAGCTALIGDTDPAIVDLMRAEARTVGAEVWERGADFAVLDSRIAVRGRVLDLKTPAAVYSDVYLPLHGEHQGDNASLALAAVEAFFDRPVDPDVVVQAFSEVTVPGRFEVVRTSPLVVLDVAHNPAGAETTSTTLAEEFDLDGDTILVVGLLAGHDPEAMLGALDAESAALVVACQPDWPRAMAAEEVAEAARRVGAEDVVVVRDPRAAVERALEHAGPDDAVVITGSFYVVGAVRDRLAG